MDQLSDQSPAKKQPIDVDQLAKDHPKDPRVGQGYNDARGEIEDDAPPMQNYQKNNLKPPAKKDPLKQPEKK